MKRFIASELGSYIINVTKAAEVCSWHLCQNNGRCIRRNWKALDYLHLNPHNFQIEVSEDQRFTVKGEASQTDLQIMTEKFTCHCYQGFEGVACRDVTVPGHSADAVSSTLVVIISLASSIFIIMETSVLKVIEYLVLSDTRV